VRLENLRDGDVSLAPETVALLPLGATEAHGTHLPHGTDTFIAGEIAERVSARFPEAVTLPVMPYGMSQHYEGLGLTVTVAPETLATVITDVLECLIRRGVRRLFVVNGHDGNIASIELAARRIRARHEITVAALEAWWWAVPSLLPDDPILREPGGHASAAETAMALAAAEHLVDMAAAHAPSTEPDTRYLAPLTGVRVYSNVGDHHAESQWLDARAASVDVGERYMDAVVTEIVSFLEFAAAREWRFGIPE
jgi:creatinine amidohydrolase